VWVILYCCTPFFFVHFFLSSALDALPISFLFMILCPLPHVPFLLNPVLFFPPIFTPLFAFLYLILYPFFRSYLSSLYFILAFLCPLCHIFSDSGPSNLSVWLYQERTKFPDV
jgi:hypothetical protein